MNPATPGPFDPDDPADEELIRRIIIEAGDASVSPRPEFVSELRTLVLSRLKPPAQRWRRTMRLCVGSGLAAILVAAVAFGLTTLRSANAWAQVATALQGRSWVHSKTVGPDNKVFGESWFSPKRRVIAFRHDADAEYHDHALRVFSKYVASEGVIYHLPEGSERMSMDLGFFTQLLGPLGPTKSPYPGMEIVAQTRREVGEDGKNWVDVELTLRVIAGDGEQQVRFRIDPRTKLPHSSLARSREGQVMTTFFDYPDHGPGDIYDLGAPRTAKLIDRIPPGDLNRVLAGLKAGRVRFDDYLAIMDWGDGQNVFRVWRKGVKWRVESLFSVAKGWPSFPRDADAAWWKLHQAEYLSITQAICDGETVFYYQTVGNVFERGRKEPPSLKLSMRQAINPSDDPFMPWPSYFVEHLGHPDVYQPTHDRDFQLEPRPDDGPPETIRLQVRDTHNSGPTRPDLYRLWIRPAQGFISMRSETSVFNAGNPPKVAYVDTMIMEDLARSPGGYWYPTKIRRVTSNSKGEQIWKYHLAFDVPIPDELFRKLP